MTERGNVYQQVTDKVIAEIEAGTLPWVRPWGSTAAPLALPKNASTGRTYSGVNILLLWGSLFQGGYSSQTWLTFKQALEMGGHVRKGEKGTTIFYADRFVPKGEQERARQEGGDPKAIPFLKAFTVFNAEQCENIPVQQDAPPAPAREMHAEAEVLIKAVGADFRIGGNDACYYPLPDYIEVPPQPAFHEQINYYRTAFHELGHWTGHASRLNRDLVNRFGTAGYAREELVAEMTSAFVCASLGIAPTVRHADYIGSWLRVLKNDNRAIFQAASAASKAADFIMGANTAAQETEAA